MKNVLDSSEQRVARRKSHLQHANPIVEWLLTEGWTVTDSAKLVERLAIRIGEEGIPVTRILLFVLSVHPQAVGIRITWQRETERADVWSAPYKTLQAAAYKESPVAAIMDGSEQFVRQRLDVPSQSSSSVHYQVVIE